MTKPYHVTCDDSSFVVCDAGEYVQLYQMQRQVLRRKHDEKDEYISRLARDRQQMQDKVAQLQALVMQLLQDRNMLHSYQKHGQQPGQQQQGLDGQQRELMAATIQQQQQQQHNSNRESKCLFNLPF